MKNKLFNQCSVLYLSILFIPSTLWAGDCAKLFEPSKAERYSSKFIRAVVSTWADTQSKTTGTSETKLESQQIAKREILIEGIINEIIPQLAHASPGKIVAELLRPRTGPKNAKTEAFNLYEQIKRSMNIEDLNTYENVDGILIRRTAEYLIQAILEPQFLEKNFFSPSVPSAELPKTDIATFKNRYQNEIEHDFETCLLHHRDLGTSADWTSTRQKLEAEWRADLKMKMDLNEDQRQQLIALRVEILETARKETQRNLLYGKTNRGPFDGTYLGLQAPARFQAVSQLLSQFFGERYIDLIGSTQNQSELTHYFFEAALYPGVTPLASTLLYHLSDAASIGATAKSPQEIDLFITKLREIVSGNG